VALPAPADKVSALLFEASAPRSLQVVNPQPED